MIKIIILVFCALVLFSENGIAGDLADQAKVVSSSPNYQTISQPTQHCWTDNTPAAPVQHNYMGAVLGAVAGGLLGNTVGQGNGRIAVTAVGATTGAMAGDRLANQNQSTSQPQQRCETVNTMQKVLQGYNVTYLYHGITMTGITTQQPAEYIPVTVTVNPSN